MGTWSTAIFGDDVALDVRESYLGHLLDGLTGEEATRRVVGDPAEPSEEDPDEGPVIWLALAATQWEYGRLEPEVKARALAVIDDGAELARWSESEQPARKTALLALRKKLTSPQPKPKKPRRKKPVEVPSHSAAGPDGLTSASAFEIGEGADRLGQVMIEMNVGGQGGGGGVFAAFCGQEQIGLRWIDADTLEISYPASARVHSRKDSSFFYGRTVNVKYRVHAEP